MSWLQSSPFDFVVKTAKELNKSVKETDLHLFLNAAVLGGYLSIGQIFPNVVNLRFLLYLDTRIFSHLDSIVSIGALFGYLTNDLLYESDMTFR